MILIRSTGIVLVDSRSLYLCCIKQLSEASYLREFDIVVCNKCGCAMKKDKAEYWTRLVPSH